MVNGRIICFLQLGSLNGISDEQILHPFLPWFIKEGILNATNMVLMECLFLTPLMALDRIGLQESDKRRRMLIQHQICSGAT